MMYNIAIRVDKDDYVAIRYFSSVMQNHKSTI